jgi:hypothetical protein
MTFAGLDETSEQMAESVVGSPCGAFPTVYQMLA